MDELERLQEIQPDILPALQSEPIDLISDPDAKRRFSRIGWGLTLMVLVWQVAAMGAIAMFGAFGLLLNGWTMMMLNFLPLWCLGLPLLHLVLRGLPNHPVPEKRPLRPGTFVLIALLGFAAAYLLNLLAAGLSSLLEALKGSELKNPLSMLTNDASSSPLAMLLFAVVIGPLVEEIIFRHILFKKLAGYGAKTYLFFSALVFALYHANLYQVFYAFALGLIFAFLTYRTGSIKASAVLHVLVNLVGLGLPLLIARFPENQTMLMGISGVVALLVLSGVAAGIILCVRRNTLALPPGAIQSPTRVQIFCNAGMIVMLVLLCVLTVLMVVL
jgi:membrane protease YdiL (CAAX protease family)